MERFRAHEKEFKKKQYSKKALQNAQGSGGNSDSDGSDCDSDYGYDNNDDDEEDMNYDDEYSEENIAE